MKESTHFYEYLTSETSSALYFSNYMILYIYKKILSSVNIRCYIKPLLLYIPVHLLYLNVGLRSDTLEFNYKSNLNSKIIQSYLDKLRQISSKLNCLLDNFLSEEYHMTLLGEYKIPRKCSFGYYWNIYYMTLGSIHHH